jgi:hypothetical protein
LTDENAVVASATTQNATTLKAEGLRAVASAAESICGTIPDTCE